MNHGAVLFWPTFFCFFRLMSDKNLHGIDMDDEKIRVKGGGREYYRGRVKKSSVCLRKRDGGREEVFFVSSEMKIEKRTSTRKRKLNVREGKKLKHGIF